MTSPRDEQRLASIRAGDRAALHDLAELIREVLRELDIPGVSDARGRLDDIVGPLRARLLARFAAPGFELRGSLRAYVTSFVALRRDELEPGAAPAGLRRLERANPEHLAAAVDTVLRKLTQSHSPDIRELAHTWLALVEEGGSLDVNSGRETARMLKTASPLLARRSEGEFAGALRAFRTTLGYELSKLGY
ncbi:hypothetical protein G6O69_35865 [Pseudenhygromyxa sp. WMMC2535]|uniref:hypothetical protein n=1 Tax=Pseudenhygromyxa sp. WMMC2535 TaxID=2712867 RepID=UPI001552DD15|nr:hypothetical protein [Pseudenhygromyxa sp. WMMC2535]NVB43257.1 hypothetical protein [Pseudenhygromyxa sp. WMMC2535]